MSEPPSSDAGKIARGRSRGWRTAALGCATIIILLAVAGYGLYRYFISIGLAGQVRIF